MRADQIEAVHEVEARCCVSCKHAQGVTERAPDQWTCGKWFGPSRAFDPVFGYSGRKGSGPTLLRLQRAVGGACGPEGKGWEIGPVHARILRSIETERIGVQP